MSRVEKQNQKIKDVLSTVQDEAEQIDRIAQIRGWFRPKADSAHYRIIQDYLCENINSDEVDAKLFGPIDEKIIASKLDDVDFLDLWYSIIHSGKRTTFREVNEASIRGVVRNHNSLVDLVVAFHGHTVKDDEKYSYLYREMTDFSMACREAYNDAPVPQNGFFSKETDAWANLNFLFARIAGKELENVDLGTYAIFAMRTALEDDHQDDPTSTAVQKYDAYIPAAAAWILGYGHGLFKTQKDLTPADDNQGDPARGGELWKGKSEFSKDRWNFWKERFAIVAKMDGLLEMTRVQARDAVEAMERSQTFMYSKELAAGNLEHFTGKFDSRGLVLERRRKEDSGCYGVVAKPKV